MNPKKKKNILAMIVWKITIFYFLFYFWREFEKLQYDLSWIEVFIFV